MIRRKPAKIPVFSGRSHSKLVALLSALAGVMLPITLTQAAPKTEPATASGQNSTGGTAAKNDDDLSEDSGESGQPTKRKSEMSVHSEAVPIASIPTGTPPAPPRPEDQEPRPYVPPPEPLVKEHHLTLYAVAGPWWHGVNGSGASTRVGPVWGASARVEPYRWLGLRVTVLRGNQPVSVDMGALGVPNTQIQQPHFQIIHWTLRMEATWHVNQALSLWMGPGLAWARAIVPEPTIGTLNWQSVDRACVYLEGQWAIGAEYEVLRDWLRLGIDLSAGAIGYQSGSAHDSMQAFTPDGHMMHVGGYPDFSRKVQALFGVGVIL